MLEGEQSEDEEQIPTHVFPVPTEVLKLYHSISVFLVSS